jgi:ABC-type glycerol-3-phosphate transport system substrate-binding protein
MKKIYYFEKWGGLEWAAMNNVVDDYNNSQDRCRVIMVESGDQYASPDREKILKKSERISPDIIGLENHLTADFGESDIIIPVEECLGNAIDLVEDFHDAFQKMCFYKGRLWCIPISANIVNLYVNIAHLEKVGMGEADFPKSLREFDHLLKEMSDHGMMPFDPTFPGWWPHIWPYFFEGSWYDQEGTFSPLSPSNLKAYSWLQLLTATRSGSKELPDYARLDNEDPFTNGKISMILDGDWLVKRLVDLKDFKWMSSGFPTRKGTKKSMVLADTLCISAMSDNIEEASGFIEYAMKPENVERIALGQMKISPLKVWSDSFIANHGNPKIVDFMETLDTDELFWEPNKCGWSVNREKIKEAFSILWRTKERPEEIFKKLL